MLRGTGEYSVHSLVLAGLVGALIGGAGVYSSRDTHCRALKTTLPGVYYRDAKMAVRPERREEFIAVIRNNGRETIGKEPNALAYVRSPPRTIPPARVRTLAYPGHAHGQVWGENAVTPNLFHFHAAYRGAEGFEEHAATPHYKAWNEFVATEPFTMAPELHTYYMVPEE